MSVPSQSDHLLVEQIRAEGAQAWEELIARYEGRLLAFVETRAGNRSAAEDIVQETFIGFLTSLPNYDPHRALESYLFSIAAHKLTDHLRREGRRPTLPLVPDSDASSWEPADSTLRASAILRSRERRGLEEGSLVAAMSEQLEHWRRRGDWLKIRCLELLLVRGWCNKEVAAELGISEQAVANHKFEFLAKLRTAVRGQHLPEEVFPELYDSGRE